MATVHIKDDTYERLSQKAAAQNTTVEEFIEPVLDQLAEAGPSSSVQPPGLAAAGREKAFSDWMALVSRRADRYPPGFLVNDSRERIYEGRGE